MKVAVIGVGHVGLVTAAAFAVCGHDVIGVDEDKRKLDTLATGGVPFYEPGLDELLAEARDSGRLAFSDSIAEALERSAVVFLCVGTPARPDGEANLTIVERVARSVGESLPRGFRLVIEKSTVPVRTGERIASVLSRTARPGCDFEVASNPEFLTEGNAVNDAMRPSRIVVGVSSERAGDLLRELYAPIVTSSGCELIVTDVRTAEILKHACNAFLATRVSYINLMARICESVGADVKTVARAMGLDPRIGPRYLHAGLGFGGYCLPKDVAAFIRITERAGVDPSLLEAVARINEGQPERVVDRVEDLLWNLEEKTVTLLGLAFKPHTDDMRESPALAVASGLRARGATVRGWDPEAGAVARETTDLEIHDDPYAACAGADAVVVCTEWPQIAELDWARIRGVMSHAVLVDGRNILDLAALTSLGFTTTGVGHRAGPA